MRLSLANHVTATLVLSLFVPLLPAALAAPRMDYQDTSRTGKPFAKDPSVVAFKGHYWMYYSLPPRKYTGSSAEHKGWSIGIAESTDLIHWEKRGEVNPVQPVESNGIAAPGARVIHGRIHIFYQTYANGSNDAICHAWSDDGIHFQHDPTNPIYHPTKMRWSAGRAIDAEVLIDGPKTYLYFATRDPSMKRQMIGMAEASSSSDLGAGSWHDVSITGPLLAPVLPWEQLCIEAPTVVKHGHRYLMFYAGAYNNSPQQIGVAISKDAKHWKRLSNHPFLANGKPGSWNSSESGHPGVLQDRGKTYLFFQGSSDHGKTYHLSVVELGWHGDVPYIKEQSDKDHDEPSNQSKQRPYQDRR